MRFGLVGFNRATRVIEITQNPRGDYALLLDESCPAVEALLLNVVVRDPGAESHRIISARS